MTRDGWLFTDILLTPAAATAPGDGGGKEHPDTFIRINNLAESLCQ